MMKILQKISVIKKFLFFQIETNFNFYAAEKIEIPENETKISETGKYVLTGETKFKQKNYFIKLRSTDGKVDFSSVPKEIKIENETKKVGYFCNQKFSFSLSERLKKTEKIIAKIINFFADEIAKSKIKFSGEKMIIINFSKKSKTQKYGKNIFAEFEISEMENFSDEQICDAVQTKFAEIVKLSDEFQKEKIKKDARQKTKKQLKKFRDKIE